MNSRVFFQFIISSNFIIVNFNRTIKTTRPISNARVAYFDNSAITELLNSHGQTKFKVYLLKV